MTHTTHGRNHWPPVVGRAMHQRGRRSESSIIARVKTSSVRVTEGSRLLWAVVKLDPKDPSTTASIVAIWPDPASALDGRDRVIGHPREEAEYIYRVVPVMFGETLDALRLSNKGDVRSPDDLADRELEA